MTPSRLNNIRYLLWVYFWLLIFDGALRKWILPGLSNPLLLVRDPLALLAIWLGWPLLFQLPWRMWMQSLLVLGLFSFLLALTFGHSDIFVALYGARILLLQLPLIFLYAAVFDRSDVVRFAWAIAWLTIPMTILIVAQSNLPSTHILNIAPGGEGTALFAGALDRSRPPGVFSFINALASFYTLAASSLFILLYGTKLKPRSILFLALVAVSLIVAQPVSISRLLLAGYIQVLVALIAGLFLSRSRLFPVFVGIIGLYLAFSIAITVPAYRETSLAFAARWENASAVETDGDENLGGSGGIFQKRVLSGIIGPLNNLEHIEFFGRGIGLGTSVGSQRISGSVTYLIGEGAWQASIGEMGIPVGLAFILWRVIFTIWLSRLSLSQAVNGNTTPLILLGSSFLPALSGQLSQPTGLGFIVFACGLTLAACNRSLFSTNLE